MICSTRITSVEDPNPVKILPNIEPYWRKSRNRLGTRRQIHQSFKRMMPQKLPGEIREIGKQFWQVTAKADLHGIERTK